MANTPIDVEELSRASVRLLYTKIMQVADRDMTKPSVTLYGVRAALAMAQHEIDERIEAWEASGPGVD